MAALCLLVDAILTHLLVLTASPIPAIVFSWSMHRLLGHIAIRS
jgi:hypothetical protein